MKITGMINGVTNTKNAQNGDNLSDKFLSDVLNQSPDFSRGETRVTFDVGKGILIEGIRNVCEYTEERLIISTYSRSLIIEGCCLCICRMLEDAIVICGNISAVKVV